LVKLSVRVVFMITLDMLLPGQSAEIVRVSGVDGIAIRLREMGFIPGEGVRLLRLAPLGDPLKCMIQGCRVAIRNREAQRVEVVPQ
jgi:ferrous iron transport protein A